MQGKVSSSLEYIKKTKQTDEFTLVIHSITSADPSSCKELDSHTDDDLLILFSHSLIKLTAGLW